MADHPIVRTIGSEVLRGSSDALDRDGKLFSLTTSPLIHLTRRQRADLFAERHPTLTFPGNKPCPVESGSSYPLSNRLKITFTSIKRGKKGEWVPDYYLTDDRPNLLRARPPAYAPEGPDKGPPDAEEISRAAIESAYTNSSRAALPGVGEAPPRGWLVGRVTQGRKDHAEHQRAERAEDLAKEDARRVGQRLRELAVQAVRAGVDPVAILAEFERRIREEEQRLRDSN